MFWIFDLFGEVGSPLVERMVLGPAYRDLGKLRARVLQPLVEALAHLGGSLGHLLG